MKLFTSRLFAAAIATANLQSISAFSGIGLRTRWGYSHSLQLKRDKDGSTEIDDVQEQIETDPIRRRRYRNFEHWGVEHLASHDCPLPVFPSTFEEVADEVFHAIVGTICGLQRPDPNVASNAMHQSVLDYRPTHPSWVSKRRWSDGDDSEPTDKRARSGKEKDIPARMGIEIDGAAQLSSSFSNDEGRAMRLLSLHIAQRLSTLPWDEMESSAGFRSVAVYFNSVEQSLLASRELNRWKKEEGHVDNDFFDHIHIHSLGQDSLPSAMVKERAQSTQQQRNNNQDKDTSAEAEDSIILIVKPTDYDTGSLIPIHGDKPSANKHHPTLQANIVDKLQSLLFQASASNIPTVVLSPRLSELPPLQQSSEETYKRTGPSGFEQSGYQKSATYGGIEPPVGPTSWLLRDLIPPVYVWVGCASTVGQRRKSRSFKSLAALLLQQTTSKAKDEYETSLDCNEDGKTLSYYAGVALTQSAMETGHAWHMFAVEEKLKPRHSVSTHGSTVSGTHTQNQVERCISYHYMGSSNASRGRPSSRIMNDVFQEFCENKSSD